MALQGTLDTFALTDVLRLLASTRKTGRLRVSGGRGSGSVWVDAGQVVASDATGLVHAVRPVDVVFELLRYADGSFTFEADRVSPDAGEPADVEPLLREAEQLLGEWREIESVVPSLDHWVALVAELPRPDVVVDAERWRTIVAVGSGNTVRRVGESLVLGEVSVSREVKHLVELGLATIGTAPAAEPGPAHAAAPEQYAAAAPAAEPAPAPAYEPEPAAPAADDHVAEVLRHPFDPMPEPEPVAAEEELPEPTPLRPVFGGLGAHAAEPQPLRPVFGTPAADPEPARPAFGAAVAAEAAPEPFRFGAAVPATDAEPFRFGGGMSAADPEPFRFGGPAPAPQAEPEPYHGFGGGRDEDHGEPSYGEPSYGEPSYGEPSYGEPSYGEHAYGGPVAVPDPDAAPSAFPPPGPTRRTLGRPLPPAPAVDESDEVARQLASLSPKAARAVAAAARAETEEEREAALAEVSAETEEPINRGLLLKFLSSVRS